MSTDKLGSVTVGGAQPTEVASDFAKVFDAVAGENADYMGMFNQFQSQVGVGPSQHNPYLSQGSGMASPLNAVTGQSAQGRVLPGAGPVLSGVYPPLGGATTQGSGDALDESIQMMQRFTDISNFSTVMGGKRATVMTFAGMLSNAVRSLGSLFTGQ